MPRGRFNVPRLVVKEKIGLKLAQKLALVQPAQEHGLVHLNVPVHQRANGALVGRGAAGRHQRRANAHPGCGGLLQAVQRHQQWFERAVRQWQRHLVNLMLLESRQTLRLVHALRFVAEQHRIPVKRNAHFGGVRVAGMGRLGVHLCGGHARFQCGAHVA